MSEELVEALRGVLRASPWTVPGAAPKNRVELAHLRRDYLAAVALAIAEGESTPGLFDAAITDAMHDLLGHEDSVMLRATLKELRIAERRYRDAKFGSEEASP